MKKLYFVFDQIPSAQSGGLIGMYLNICEILKYDYDIEIAQFRKNEVVEWERIKINPEDRIKKENL